MGRDNSASDKIESGHNDSVIERLESWLIMNAEVLALEDPDAAYWAAAYLLMKDFLGAPFAKTYHVVERLEGRLANKALTIGETLFELRDSPCFSEFCRRITSRTDNEAAFYEVFCARLMLDAGFEIKAIKESGKKGDDFDFSATKGMERIAVEVTCLRNEYFNSNSVKNALQSKIKQLPSLGPNLVIMILPEGWFDAANALEALLSELRRIFKVSKRVNAVLFVSAENTSVSGDAGEFEILQYRFWSVRNLRPRTSSDAIQMLINTYVADDFDLLREPGIGTAPTHEAIRLKVRDRPFFNWVDAILGREPQSITQ